MSYGTSDTGRCVWRPSTRTRLASVIGVSGCRAIEDSGVAEHLHGPQALAHEGAAQVRGSGDVVRDGAEQDHDAHSIGAGRSNEERTATGPPARRDSSHASRASTTWAACSALMRWGRPVSIASARSTSGRAQPIPRYGS